MVFQGQDTLGSWTGSGEWAKAAERSLSSYIPYIWVPTGEGVITGCVLGPRQSDQLRVRPPSTPPFSEEVRAPRVAWRGGTLRDSVPWAEFLPVAAAAGGGLLGGWVSRCGSQIARHKFVSNLSHLQSSNLTSKSSVFAFPVYVQPLGSKRKRALTVPEAQATAVPCPWESPEGSATSRCERAALAGQV